MFASSLKKPEILPNNCRYICGGKRNMNPPDRFKIDEYKKLLKDLEHIDEIENLRELEERIVKEIVDLIDDGSDMAKYLLEKLEKAIRMKLSFLGHKKVLTRALRESVTGAFAVARDTMLKYPQDGLNLSQ